MGFRGLALAWETKIPPCHATGRCECRLPKTEPVAPPLPRCLEKCPRWRWKTRIWRRAASPVT